MIEYIVEWADYEPDLCHCSHCNDAMADFDSFYKFHESNISDRIDDRTVRSRVFEKEDDANELANDILKRKKSEKWLAYLRIKKIESEVIKEFK